MALTAILAKLILMRIFMTTGTVTVLNTAELLKFFPVSQFQLYGILYNQHFLCLSGKLKFGIGMIKF